MSQRKFKSTRSHQHYPESNHNLKIVKTEIQENGEAFQLVRPMQPAKNNAQDIVSNLIQQYGTRKNRHQKRYAKKKKFY